MSMRKFINNALSEWMRGTGDDTDIVISSRIRIARNIQDIPFPIIATPQQSKEVLDKVEKIIVGSSQADRGSVGALELVSLEQLNDLERKVLVEKHLISPSLAEQSKKGAVILNDNESVSIMINEEDHLRIQCLKPGFQIREAWETANRIDDWFEEKLDYAFDEKKGYLTSCPTNVGTGIRASVMMHLPALVLTQQMNRLLSAIAQVGLVVRGLYGEGSEATGNLFQVSNQITLGQSEEEIIDNLYGVVRQIIEHERAARAKMMAESKLRITDRIRRSYGILSNALVMDSKEAAQRLSDVRLGIDLGIVSGMSTQVLNELTVTTQPGFLQQFAGKKLSPEERDIRRAEMIRSRFEQV